MLMSCGGGHPPPVPQALADAERSGDPLAPKRLMADVLTLCAPEFAGRGSFQPGGERAAQFMEAALRETGLEIVKQPIAGGAVTIVGIKRAGPEAIIVSAHYDHLGMRRDGVVFPGADDNASGAAVLLGMARKAKSKTFRNTVLFVSFGAEELGLVGSGVYVASPAWPLERTRAVINFDMVGRNFFESGANREAAAAVVGLSEVPGAERVAKVASAAVGLDLISTPARLVELFGYANRTDEWWFRRQGIPSIHFSTGMHDDYHQPSDTPAKIVPEQMHRIGSTAFDLLEHLANSP